LVGRVFAISDKPVAPVRTCQWTDSECYRGCSAITEGLEQLGGKIEYCIPTIDFVEETGCWLAFESTPASAG
jgi:hypothetical protein